jgi:hypothetical protein
VRAESNLLGKFGGALCIVEGVGGTRRRVRRKSKTIWRKARSAGNSTKQEGQKPDAGIRGNQSHRSGTFAATLGGKLNGRTRADAFFILPVTRAHTYVTVDTENPSARVRLIGTAIPLAPWGSFFRGGGSRTGRSPEKHATYARKIVLLQQNTGER